MVNNRAFGRWRNPPRLPGMNSAPWNLDYDPAYYDYNYNYNLDDNEIADIVVDTLNSNPYIYRPDKESIVVDVKDSVVTLSGKVKNKRSKYRRLDQYIHKI